jgi:hypothetical protein
MMQSNLLCSTASGTDKVPVYFDRKSMPVVMQFATSVFIKRMDNENIQLSILLTEFGNSM